MNPARSDTGASTGTSDESTVDEASAADLWPEPSVVEVDGGSRQCIDLLLLVRRHVQMAPVGNIIRLTTDDAIAQIDLAAWCYLTGHTWLGAQPVPTPPSTRDGPPPQLTGPDRIARSCYAVRVEPEARGTYPHRPWRLAPPTITHPPSEARQYSRTGSLAPAPDLVTSQE